MTLGRSAMIASLAVMGAAVGLGIYTFAYAKGWSYLTDDPKACANCHVMSEQYEGWLKASHRSVAVCNDCHVPDNFVGKYYTKANHGFWHSFYFTTQTFHEPIRMTAQQPEGHRGEVPRLSRTDRASHGHAGARGLGRHLLHSLSRIRRAHAAIGDLRRSGMR